MSDDLPQLPPRPADGHKGTFGTVCVIGGQANDSRVMVGGPAFSSLAALRSGCGLAVLAVPKPLMAASLIIAPSATGLALPVDEKKRLVPSDVAELLDGYLSGFHCIAVGPGLGSDEPQQQIVLRLVTQEDVPLVIDADALNALAQVRNFHGDFRAHTILTPHPGEYRRLAETLGIARDPTSAKDRADAASEMAQRLGCVVVLKGHETVTSDGLNTHVNDTGNVALATAGTGDILTGLIAGLVAQHFKPNLGTGSRQITTEQRGGLTLYDCARLGVHFHGLAADRWAKQHGNAGMLATDLLSLIPDAMIELR